MTRILCSFAFTATALVMSCAANPSAPSPVKKEDPPAATLRHPDALLARHAAGEQCEAGARRAGLHDHSA